MAAKETQEGSFNKFHPVVTKRASEEIYEQIKNLITSDELKPGNRLPSERDMMDMFRRSRPTIREALRMLERAGYIRTIPGSSGAVVMEPNEKIVQQNMEDALQMGHISLSEMSEYRKASEAATVAWAAQRNTPEDIDAMQEILNQMEVCINDHEKFVGMDSQFHGLLACAAKNKVSVAMNKTLSNLNRSFMKEKMSTMTLSERDEMCVKVHEMHKAIFSAVRDRDVERASRAMNEHLTAFLCDLR